MKPKRIQRKRIRGWRMPKNTIYVGRPSKWGNPATLKNYGDAQKCVDYYESYLRTRRKSGENVYFSIMKELGGKDLACWCPLYQPCHADVLLKIANEETR